MTCKDCLVIAQSLANANPDRRGAARTCSAEELAGRRHQWQVTCTVFAWDLEITNPRFDRELFLKACGVQS